MAFHNILVATDFSPCSQAAFSQALELAATCRGRVHLLHVYALPGLPEGAPLSRSAIEDAELAGVRKLQALGEAQRATGLVGDTFVRMGDAPHVIVSVAAEVRADLIALGTHGRRGLARFVLGSVAATVARTAPCSVLVARDTVR